MKNLILFFVFLVSCLQIVGCAPKMHITYNIESDREYLKKDICDKKTGVLLFDDKRNMHEMDRFFEKAPTEVVGELLVTKFKAHCGENVHSVDHKTSELDSALMEKLNKDDGLDYLLVGSFSSFNSNFKDKNSGLRTVGSVISGLTFPVGLVIFPFVFMGNVDQITDIQIDNITLIDAEAKQILWRGRINKQNNEVIPFIQAGLKTNEERYNTYGKEVVDNIFQNISLSYDMNFPNKLSMDNSKIVFSYMGESSSTGVIEY